MKCLKAAIKKRLRKAARESWFFHVDSIEEIQERVEKRENWNTIPF